MEGTSIIKTIQEIYNEVLKNDELKKDFAEAVQNKTVEDFLKSHGCEATMEDVAAFLKEQQAKNGELADNELDNVAAGGCNETEAVISACSLGIACAVIAAKSLQISRPNSSNSSILCAGEK